MATETEKTGTVVQSWVPLELAVELKQHADRERRSVSAVIRHVLEDAVRPDERRP